MIDRPTTPPLAYRARLDELEGCWLEIECDPCRSNVLVPMKLIIRNKGGHHAIGSLVPRIVCKRCGQKPSRMHLNETHNRKHNGGAAPGWSVQLWPLP